MLLRPTTIFTIMSFLLGAVKGSTACLLHFDSSPASTEDTHTHTLIQVHRERNRQVFVVFFFPFIPVWQGHLIPNILYQDGPTLSIIKWVNIDFLQENHTFTQRCVVKHHLVQKFRPTRILFVHALMFSFNYPSRIFTKLICILLQGSCLFDYFISL